MERDAREAVERQADAAEHPSAGSVSKAPPLLFPCILRTMHSAGPVQLATPFGFKKEPEELICSERISSADQGMLYPDLFTGRRQQCPTAWPAGCLPAVWQGCWLNW